MKKLLFIIVSILLVGLVVMLLVMNKSKNEQKQKQIAVVTSFSVTVQQVEKKFLDENLTLTGTINANRELTVISETQGKIKSIYFNIGDFVGSGKVLVSVDDEIRKATLSTAEASYEKAKKDYERYEQLNKEKSVNDAQLEQARLAYRSADAQLIIAKKQLNDTKIVAPFGGVITSRNVEIGTVVNPGTPIASIIEIGQLKIKVNVPENDVFKLKTGDKVDIVSEVYPEIIFKGTIKNINSKADEAHTYAVEISLNNDSKHPLKAGMFAKVAFKSLSGRDCLVIPRSAIVGSIKSPQVYVAENGFAKLRNIQTGMDYNNNVEVLSGLNQGELVITSGQINLRDNSQITITK